jgi:hypothetical protein
MTASPAEPRVPCTNPFCQGGRCSAGYPSSPSASVICERCAGTGYMLADRHPPPQYVMVPREPTEVMLVAALDATDPLGKLVNWEGDNCNTRDAVRDAYRAMLATAPAAPPVEHQQQTACPAPDLVAELRGLVETLRANASEGGLAEYGAGAAAQAGLIADELAAILNRQPDHGQGETNG